ncbi:hypothetical protein Clacol_000954 [Clathrus columnatus]|uniref:Uncharacterized protein n=1 Tax=Clathrus columnatus TaxID=1419009 RepID=A0AAV5A0M9_9AGAM|nr:hypothetical protein Clacol_000954 [Clathrus columnatus]
MSPNPGGTKAETSARQFTNNNRNVKPLQALPKNLRVPSQWKTSGRSLKVLERLVAKPPHKQLPRDFIGICWSGPIFSGVG